MHRTRLAGIATILLALACGGDAPPADDAAATPGGAAASSGAAPGANEFAQDYRLTMPAVERLYRAQRGIHQAVGDDRAEALMEADGAATIEQFASRVGSDPGARQAIEAAGLDAREYARVFIALTAARGADALVQGGTSPDSVVAQGYVSADNLEFAAQNRAALDRLDEQFSEETDG